MPMEQNMAIYYILIIKDDVHDYRIDSNVCNIFSFFFLDIFSTQDKMRRLLGEKGIVVEDHIRTAIARNGWLSARLSAISSFDDAWSLYEDVARIPRSKTRALVLQNHDIIIDGVMMVPGIQTALFLHAFEHGVPKVIKVPHFSKAIKECRFFQQHGSSAETKDVALVPVAILFLEGKHTDIDDTQSIKRGILMPAYPCTLSSLCNLGTPFDADKAIVVLDRLAGAVSFMHDCKWLHGDIKPSNIFIDWKGCVRLGDYGSSVPYSELHQFTGGTPQYQVEQVTASLNPYLFDVIGIVLSILELLGKSLGKQYAVVSVKEIDNSISELKPSGIQDRLTSLLKSAISMHVS